jgi:hypothetical protein
MSKQTERKSRTLRWLGSLALLLTACIVLVLLAPRLGLVANGPLELQLRDRGTVATIGSMPLSLRRLDTNLVDYRKVAALQTALESNNSASVVTALREARLDGILVRTDRALGAPSSVLFALTHYRTARGLSATWLDSSYALYEVREQPTVSVEDAPKLIECVRLIIRGGAAPSERLFAEPLRGARPAEVMVVIRDGSAPILWRAVRGGSVARALVDATYAVIDRWNTRQVQSYGPLREAIRRMPITVAIFYDKGTLETREPAWLDRAVDSGIFAVGYERLGHWEYVLPTAPGAPRRATSQALSDLVREHDVPPPGFQRTDLVLYRFRALQLIEDSAESTVTIRDPS